jgi:outer membrane protein OmpA-like peptidoglycan-associated protein
MDEILGENPFAMPGEPGSIAEVLEAGEWEGEEPFRQEAAEARLDEWESELGEQPWSGEQERGWARPGRHSGRGPYRGQPPSFAGTPLPGAPTPGQSPGPATGLATDANAVPDVTWRNEPWTLGKPGRHQTAEGTATQQKIAESAAVRLLELGDFDVDDYRLRPAHRALLGVQVAGLAAALRSGRIVAPVHIWVQGRTSSSGSMSHNLALSRNRAVNVLNMVRLLAKQAGIDAQVKGRWTPVGESVSQTSLGDSVESPAERQVRVEIIAPRPAGFAPPAPPPSGVARGGVSTRIQGGAPYRRGYPVARRHGFNGPSRRPGSGVAHLCFEVVSVKPSRGFAWLRVGGASTASARIRVHDHRTRSTALYVLQGVLLKSSAPASPGMMGRLSPLARLARIARRILGIAARATIPTRKCAPTSVMAPGADPIRLLSGVGILVIPPAGSGRAALHLRPKSPRVRLTRRLVPIRAKRYPSPLMLVGRLRLVPQGVRWGTGSIPRFRELGESEFGEQGEYGEISEVTEFGEYGELGELGEYGESEFGEFGELTEYGEFEGESEFEGELTEYGEVNEFGEQGESEFGELESELSEYGELGESELGEFEGEYEFGGELNEYGEAEWGEYESELGEFEGLGELNEYGELGG